MKCHARREKELDLRPSLFWESSPAWTGLWVSLWVPQTGHFPVSANWIQYLKKLLIFDLSSPKKMIISISSSIRYIPVTRKRMPDLESRYSEEGFSKGSKIKDQSSLDYSKSVRKRAVTCEGDAKRSNRSKRCVITMLFMRDPGLTLLPRSLLVTHYLAFSNHV